MTTQHTKRSVSALLKPRRAYFQKAWKDMSSVERESFVMLWNDKSIPHVKSVSDPNSSNGGFETHLACLIDLMGPFSLRISMVDSVARLVAIAPTDVEYVHAQAELILPDYIVCTVKRCM